MAAQPKHGQICHVELHSKDFKGSQKFYETLFGWKFDLTMGDEYLMFNDGSGFVGGGFHKDTPVSTGAPLVYILTDDLVRSLGDIVKAGGQQVQDKMEIPNVGWWGSFKDTQGNVLGLFEGANH